MRELASDAGWLREESIKKHEAFIARFDTAIQPVMFGGPDKTISDESFRARLDKLQSDLLEIRNIKQNITIPVGTGSLSFFSDTPLPLRAASSVAGEWISPAIVAGDIPGATGPQTPPEKPEPPKKEED